MALSGAERQKIWRDKRNALARQAEAKLRNSGEATPLRNDKLTAKLEPLLEGLFEEGQKGMATMSPNTVGRNAILLERALIEHGIMPESRRSKDPQGYARSIQARHRASTVKVGHYHVLQKGRLVKLDGTKGLLTVIEDPGPADVQTRLVKLQPTRGAAITGRRDWIHLRS
jgi:hypothetical protein